MVRSPQPQVPQNGIGEEKIAVRNHQATRQYAGAAFKDAHVDVELKGRYTLSFQMGRGKSDLGGVGCA